MTMALKINCTATNNCAQENLEINSIYDYNLEGHREIAKAMSVHEISHRHLAIRAILTAPG